MRVVKALRREEANLDEFKDLTGEMYRAGYRAAWLSALFLPAVQMIAPSQSAPSSGTAACRRRSAT